MTVSTINLAVVVASTRKGRFGPAIARWFADHATSRGASVDVIDLATLTFPLDMSEHPDVAAFAGRIAAADAVVIVTPEYNHSFPGLLKIAIDSLKSEWVDKPIGFVSYGGLSGGLRAVEALRLVMAELRAVGIRDAVSFHGVWTAFVDGHPVDPQAETAADVVLDELARWTARDVAVA